MAGVIGKIVGKLLGIGRKKPEETLVGKVVTRLIPDKAGQERFFAELEREYKEHEHEYSMAILADLKSAREMFSGISNKFSDILRTIPRPYIAMIAGTAWLISLVAKDFKLDYYDYGVIGSVLSFYFGFRHIEKVKTGKMLKPF
jgi:hypothetical protein